MTPNNRIIALLSLLNDLTPDKIKTTNYFEDLEPMSAYDGYFQGKLLALTSHLKYLKLDLEKTEIEEFMPLNGNAVQAITFITDNIAPIVRDHIDSMSSEQGLTEPSDIWSYIHPRVRALAKDRFEHSFHADAVGATMREVNNRVKHIVLNATDKELDGAALMTTAFSPNSPIIKLADTETETGRNLQQGYMHLFQGAMIGIRNPKAHENYDTERNKAIHLIFIASLLMYKIDERYDDGYSEKDTADLPYD